MVRSRRLAFVLVVAVFATITNARAQESKSTEPKTEPPLSAPAESVVPISPTSNAPPQPERKSPTPEPPQVRTTRGEGPAAIGRVSILRLFTQANPMLWPLGLCSVIALGYTLERMIALRRERVIPRDFVTRFLERLASGKLDRDRAAELCKANDSPVARIFAQVVSYWGLPGATIRQALGYDAASELIDLKRNIRVLNGTATLAPLLGLLGTVVGMIQSFDALGGKVGSGKGEALAHGISLALVTTAMGLAIAVVSVTAYYYLLNRVDLLVRDLDENARKVIDLVSLEAIRPTASERRPNFASQSDHPRHESRNH